MSQTVGGLKVDEVVDTFMELELENGQVVVPMLWGQPGVGKSEGMVQYLMRLQEKYPNKRVRLHDERLTLYNAVDLRGLPVPNEDKTESVWLVPELFSSMDDSEDVINILFLDEFSSAKPQVLVATYQLLLDRRVGKHELPDNCIVVAAGNRLDDRGVSHKMPSPLANRITHLTVDFDMESWRDWGFENGMNSTVLGFVSARNDLANTFEKYKGTANAFATPRSWKKVSDLMNREGFSKLNEDLQYKLIGGTVGDVVGEFMDFEKITSEAPTFNQIKEGKAKDFDLDEVDRKEDVEHFLFSSIVGNMTGVSESDKKGINNVLDFVANKFSGNEMITLTYVSMLKNVKHLKGHMLNNKSFSDWATKNRQLIQKLKNVG